MWTLKSHTRQMIVPLLPASGFSPTHRNPHRPSKPMESQPTEITQCFFGQALEVRVTRIDHARPATYRIFSYFTLPLGSIMRRKPAWPASTATPSPPFVA